MPCSESVSSYDNLQQQQWPSSAWLINSNELVRPGAKGIRQVGLIRLAMHSLTQKQSLAQVHNLSELLHCCSDEVGISALHGIAHDES